MKLVVKLAIVKLVVVKLVVGILACTLLANAVRAQDAGKIVVGSKNFTESAILAEIIAQTIEAKTSLVVERRVNLGGTMICWAALKAGEIDLYAEYSGTGRAAILGDKATHRDSLRTFLEVRRRCLAEHGVRWLDPFGFNNTYAIAMRESHARELGVSRISDLRAHQDELRGGFSVEFLEREDGYRGLQKAYDLELSSARGMEHALAYPAIESSAIDVMDVYSTDGKLLRYDLFVLEDDRRFFPPYDAAPVVREASLRAHPEIGVALESLAFRISDRLAQALNYLVENEGVDPEAVARAFLQRAEIAPATSQDSESEAVLSRLEQVLVARPTRQEAESRRRGFVATVRARAAKTLRLLLEHLGLTFAAVLLATLVAIPLGIAITKRPRLRRITLGFANVLQTIPSLALLALMIPILGLDVKAAIAALFLYALLPILRNTYTGIVAVDPVLLDAARGLGLRDREILTKVQLPLAWRTILAGVRTATVISVGVATLAAFIGAGGLGEAILEGLYLNDQHLILTGAIPAALLALACDAALGRVERRLEVRRS